MIRLLLVRPEAEKDLAAACNWYDQKRAGLGDEFFDEVGRAMHELEFDPERARLYFRDFRRVLIRRFPYKIFLPSARRPCRHIPCAPCETSHVWFEMTARFSRRLRPPA